MNCIGPSVAVAVADESVKRKKEQARDDDEHEAAHTPSQIELGNSIVQQLHQSLHRTLKQI